MSRWYSPAESPQWPNSSLCSPGGRVDSHIGIAAGRPRATDTVPETNPSPRSPMTAPNTSRGVAATAEVPIVRLLSTLDPFLPLLMFPLAWVLPPDLPKYRTGIIIVGLARCIAMVLIWNDLALGNREAAAVLVALNAVFQVAFYSVLGYFYLRMLPGWLGLDTSTFQVSLWEIARIVLVFLGVPLVAGYLTRRLGERARGREWYEAVFIPRVAPAAMIGLLFTLAVLFALQGEKITSQPLDVARIALPLLLYFLIMWAGGFALGLRLKLPYDRNATLAFTAASNDFELAIAVAIGVFGITSGEALAGGVGP